MKQICLLLLVFAFMKNSYSKGFGGYINIHEFTAVTSINEFITDSTVLKFLPKFTIISYNVFYQPVSGEAELVTNDGADFKDVVKKLISKAKPNDIYYFEDIKVLGSDNLTRKIAGFAFKIEE